MIRSLPRGRRALAFALLAPLGIGSLPALAATQASYVVTTVADSGAGSLRQAMLDANAVAGPHTITFAVTGTIALASALPAVSQPMTISGPGVDQLTIAGNGTFGIFQVQNTLAIDHVTVSGGFGPNASFGGAFQVFAALSVDQCVLRNNDNPYGLGGAIDVIGGSVTVSNSLLTANKGVLALHSGSATLSNITMSGNIGYNVYYFPDVAPVSVTLQNSTIADGNGILFDGRYNAMSLTIGNTILAGTGPNAIFSGAVAPTIQSLGGNVVDDATLPIAGPGDLLATDPLLAPLGAYGGPTATRALLPGSPAIDHAIAAGAPAADQRGIARPQLAGVDSGAFESRGFVLALGGGDNQSAALNTSFANPLAVAVSAIAAGEPVDGGRVTFSAPASGASAGLAANPASVGAGTAASGATANATPGSYVVTAAAAGASGTVSFNLDNITTPVTLQTFEVE